MAHMSQHWITAVQDRMWGSSLLPGLAKKLMPRVTSAWMARKMSVPTQKAMLAMRAEAVGTKAVGARDTRVKLSRACGVSWTLQEEGAEEKVRI